MKKTYAEDELRNLKLLVTLSRCHSSVNRRIYPDIKEQGITESQFSVLEILFHKGELTIKDLIEKTFSSGGNLTVVVNNLLKEGLVNKRRSHEDGRVWLISISDKGLDLIDNIFTFHIENLKKAFGVLTEGEQMIMIELLKKLGKG